MIQYNLDRVNELRALSSHILPEDWDTSTEYNPALVAIYRAYLEFLKNSDLKSLELQPGALLYLVKPVLPWYAPDQSNLQLIALIIHYLTTKEAHGYKNKEELHTAHSIKTDGCMRSSCWQLVRHSFQDEGFFTSIRVKVCPVAFPYQMDIDHVFVNEDDARQVLVKYGKFLQTVVDEVSKVHMCSQMVATKMADYGIPNFDDYYSSNPDKFFSLEILRRTSTRPAAITRHFSI